MPKLINLKETCGHKYRIDYERGINGKPVGRIPEYMQLKSAIGHVFVHSATHLGFATDKNRPSLRKVPELELVQDGGNEDGQNYIFPLQHLDKLAKVLKLYRRKQISEAERNRLRQMGREHGFGKDAA